MELPGKFTEEMKELLGGEFSAWLKSFEREEGSSPSSGQAAASGSRESLRGLRVNTLKTEPEAFRKRFSSLLRSVPWTKNGFYIEGDQKASKHPYYAAGLYYLQEPSAMTPAAALPIEEGDRVLDLCAAPGGKSTELAARLLGTGLLVANDISNSRAKALLKNLELFGAENILVTSESPDRLCSYFEGFFDKILIDAPCSGEGMFRKAFSMVRDWKEKGPDYYAQLQKEIVSQAARLLRPGGLLLYSTCTFSVKENEETVLTLLRSEPGFRVLPLALPRPAEEYGFAPGRPDLVSDGSPPSAEEAAQLRLAARLYPHRIDGEGHFAALLQKQGAAARGRNTECRAAECGTAGRKAAEYRAEERRESGLPEEWREFSRLLRRPFDERRIRLYDGRLYLLPEELLARNIRGLRFLRTGLLLGEMKGKHFEPSQALAMSLRREEFAAPLDFSLEDERVLRYLKGETLDVEEKEASERAEDAAEELSGSQIKKKKSGQKKKDKDKDKAGSWRLVCVDGFPLGWGKLSNGMLKNKYYPGWRW